MLLDFNLHLQSFWYKNDKMIKGKPCFNLLDNIMFVVMKNKKKKYILSPFYSKIYIYYAKNNT